jgi:uncharacterized membrane protein HdeD (DUF308 family)
MARIGSRSREVPFDSDEVDRLAFRIRFLTKIIAGGLGLLFAALLLRDVPLSTALEDAPPGVLLKLIIAAYYLSWVFGVTTDVALQHDAYVRDPDHGEIKKDSLVGLALFVLAAGALLYASGNYVFLAPVLAVFFITNVVGWWLIVRRVAPMVRESLKDTHNLNRYFEFERAKIVGHYITGDWQKARFGALAVVVIFVNLESFLPALRLHSGEFTHFLFPEVPAAAIAALFPVFSVALFVLIGDGWMWAMRVHTLASVHVLKALKKDYTLKRLKAPPELSLIGAASTPIQRQMQSVKEAG